MGRPKSAVLAGDVEHATADRVFENDIPPGIGATTQPIRALCLNADASMEDGVQIVRGVPSMWINGAPLYGQAKDGHRRLSSRHDFQFG
jgi:hypothetical protein